MAEQAYFNRFPDFERDPQAKLRDEFNQLAISEGWKKRNRSDTYKKEREEYVSALADTYIGSIERGGAVEKLAGLQGLCQDLRISPIPTSITQCKKELKKVNVCIIDLIDSRRLGTQVDRFSTPRELQAHITTAKHYFPKDGAKNKADGILKVLLKRMDG